MDDIDTIVSLRVNATIRLYGIRDGHALQILWYDPWHDSKDMAVYPVRK